MNAREMTPLVLTSKQDRTQLLNEQTRNSIGYELWAMAFVTQDREAQRGAP